MWTPSEYTIFLLVWKIEIVFTSTWNGEKYSENNGLSYVKELALVWI